jgi:low temperature requirement protein LtrA
MSEEEDTVNEKDRSPDIEVTHQHGTQGRAHEHHQAHHLKFGDIAVSGFAPPSVDGNEDSDVDDPCHHSSDRNQRRRKMARDRSMEALDAEARRIHAQRRYLIRRPRALQYFRGSTLVRSDEERSSDRLELFFDLTFVGIIAVLAEEAVKEPTGPSVVRYIITYTAAYTVWSMMKEASNAFHNHDLTQKMTVLFVMACLVIYGNNAPKVQQTLSEGSARAAAVGSYLLAEFALIATMFYYSFHIKAYRAQLRIHSGLWLITSGIWIGCIFVDIRSAIAMAFVAIALEMASWHFAYSLVLKKLLRLRYSSALNIEHEIERFNDFYTLVIGEFLFSIFSGSPIGHGIHIAAARAVLAVVIAFCFQLLYMQGGGSKYITHPLRRVSSCCASTTL